MLRVAVIGAGQRGCSLSRQLAGCGVPAQIVAVAEPDEGRRREFSLEHGIPEAGQFASWEELAGAPEPCDAAIIATMDNQHTGPALAFLRKGCHLLLEKPLSDTLEGCRKIAKAQAETGRVLSVCHTLRYADAFRRVKEIVDSGALGRLVHVEHMEAINHLWFTHNYVRGRWAREEGNAPLLLHKCCHDIDFIAWLVGRPCERVSSFGGLSYFTPENAPQGAARDCLECRLSEDCPYSAVGLYVDGGLPGRVQGFERAGSREERLELLKRSPFRACVWHAGNNVVDHQSVSMEFEGGATATCALSGYSATHGRRTRLQGVKGELLFDEAQDRIELRRFSGATPELIQLQKPGGSHPEDKDIVGKWLSAISGGASGDALVGAQEALTTHSIVFAAELSRKERRLASLSEL